MIVAFIILSVLTVVGLIILVRLLKQRSELKKLNMEQNEEETENEKRKMELGGSEVGETQTTVA